MGDITVQAVRPLMWFGNVLQPGQTLKVDPLQAQHLLDSGRAKLLHQDDADACRQAVRDDIKKQLRHVRSRVDAPPSPWRPV
jgi:hypothetical protein